MNACVYLAAKILVFFELSKLFVIFFKSLAHALLQVSQARNLYHCQQMAYLVAYIDHAFMQLACLVSFSFLRFAALSCKALSLSEGIRGMSVAAPS